MSKWTETRDDVTGEAKGLWFGASWKQKGILVASHLIVAVLAALLF